MTDHTDQQFIIAANNIATLILSHADRMNIPANQISNLAGAALAQVLGVCLGPAGAIERMRDIADQLEIRVYDQPLASTGQLLVVAWLRADVQLVQPKSFCKPVGIIPA